MLLSLTSGEVVGYEALVRFDDSRNLPPSWWLFEQAHRFGLAPGSRPRRYGWRSRNPAGPKAPSCR